MGKRLEVWMNLYEKGIGTAQGSEREATTLGKRYGALRVAVRLVECAPDETVVSKAELRALRSVAKMATNAEFWRDPHARRRLAEANAQLVKAKAKRRRK